MTDKTDDELRTFCNDLMKASSPLSNNYSPSPMAVYAVARYALQRLDAPGPRLTAAQQKTLASCREVIGLCGVGIGGELLKDLFAVIDCLSAQPKGRYIPHPGNCGKIHVQQNDGTWLYLNHADEWCTFQGPESAQPRETGKAETHLLTDAYEKLGDLYTKTNLDWELVVHVTLTEPTCPTVIIRPEGGNSSRYRFDCDTIEEGIAKAVSAVHREVLLGEKVEPEFPFAEPSPEKAEGETP